MIIVTASLFRQSPISQIHWRHDEKARHTNLDSTLPRWRGTGSTRHPGQRAILGRRLTVG